MSDTDTLHPAASFQDTIAALEGYWRARDCMILRGYDSAVGAGTFHPATALYSLGPFKEWRVAYVQPSRRPGDGRYGENPNRLQHYYQFQVLLRPAPADCRDLYLESLAALGLEAAAHDLRFMEDDWESPTLGAAGLGWEVWCDGLEISQFTYFQQMGGIECEVVSVELTYGLERIACMLQGCESVYDLEWGGGKKYGDIHRRGEREFSAYNYERSSVELLWRHFKDAEEQCAELLKSGLALPAYDECLKASHIFNLLDARGAILQDERQSLILRVRTLVKGVCEAWVKQ
ncbi:MAG: glycine--tRNA ligase subunit alpha [Alphaproteobacteria bacterium]|nr:glycine--tRNA ligase subunit alpha [Alphaproteobacteria bacterium]MDA8003512.1 glycine--tRNA ligase subunit alpha [Alphaproteobacteria bacterium]MDA8005505.1 glycine--tRNA ligase subunit alpha [Alphaproteobacteria bacterium]MDA8013769.1 glycine--tRNA ligase subunit alpha [Alphaproteobacteria bacterium]